VDRHRVVAPGTEGLGDVGVQVFVDLERHHAVRAKKRPAAKSVELSNVSASSVRQPPSAARADHA
jgi:hypothetical protein